MGILVALILAIVGAVFLFGNSNYYLPQRPALPVIGFLLILVASYCLGSVFILKDDIKEREKVITSQESLAYELVPFNFATSEVEIEHSDNQNSYYIHVYEHDQLHFYYKTKQNGNNGFSPKTIYSNNVFITEDYEGTPLILEITTVYEYPMDKFEKWWLNSSDIYTLRPTTIVKYEIYVPTNSIIETFDPEQ